MSRGRRDLSHRRSGCCRPPSSPASIRTSFPAARPARALSRWLRIVAILLTGLTAVQTASAAAARSGQCASAGVLPFWPEWADRSGQPPPAARQQEIETSVPAESAIREHHSHLIPALEILGFDFLLNQTNRRRGDGADYDSSFSTIWFNLRHKWVVDDDPFATNQLGHPYQGSIYHEIARSAGLNYWESLGYTFAGSLLWEIAGETTPPSRNDQVASGIGGAFLGEPLFRMAGLVLENADGRPGFWRQLAGGLIAPPAEINRLLFADRFDTVFPGRNPVYYSRLHLGMVDTTQDQPGPSTKVEREEGQVDFALDYGLPGKPGYVYRRPFDYFSFQATTTSANGFESVMTRGLLVGSGYAAGSSHRGVWGLYGSYDYIAPQLFRVSSTALLIGTTSQWGTAHPIALQTTGLLGAGYAAVGTLHGTSDRDYHYGVAPQILIALRLILSGAASLDLSARNYLVSGVATDRGGRDDIARGEASFTLRIRRSHAVALKYLWSRRDASYPDLADSRQTRGTIGLFYACLGHDRFGAVDWR